MSDDWPRPPAPADPEITLHTLPPAKLQVVDVLWIQCSRAVGADLCFEAAQKYEVGFRPKGAAADEPLTRDLDVAAGVFERLCTVRGDARACGKLGYIYLLKGLGPLAAYYLDRACRDLWDRFEKSWGSACFNLGMVYRGDLVGPPDEEHAQALFRKACTHHVELACESLLDLGSPRSVASDLASNEPQTSGLGFIGTQGAAPPDPAVSEPRPNAARDALPQTSRGRFELVVRRCTHSSQCFASFADAHARPTWSYSNELFQHDAALSAALFEQACNLGLAVACSRLADIFEEGLGVPRDARQAVALNSRACHQLEPPSASACNNLGLEYLLGVGVAPDDVRARASFDLACKAGNAVGCENLAEAVETDRRTSELLARNRSLEALGADRARALRPLLAACTHDPASCNGRGISLLQESPPLFGEAAAFLEQGCLLEVAPSCGTLGALLYLGTGMKADRNRGEPMLQTACEGGVATACANFGVAELTRKTVDGDRRALDAFDAACAGQNADGCANLGWMREVGRGGKADLRASAEHYENACRLGSSIGCRNLAAALALGRGVKMDVQRAVVLYRTSCDQKDTRACISLVSLALSQPRSGATFIPGRDVPVLERACLGGAPRACLNLGYVFDQGFGLPRDVVRAARLFASACKGREALGCSNAGAIYATGGGEIARSRARSQSFYARACSLGLAKACELRELLGAEPE